MMIKIRYEIAKSEYKYVIVVLFLSVLMSISIFHNLTIKNELNTKLNAMISSRRSQSNDNLFLAKNPAVGKSSEKLTRQIFNEKSGVKVIDFKMISANKMGDYYEKRIAIKLKGSFKQILSYIKTLDNTPYIILWHQVDYTVSLYPYADVVLTIGVVGDENIWI
jgi:hypothetical protein